LQSLVDETSHPEMEIESCVALILILYLSFAKDTTSN
jgi:hypothetical protein